MSGARSRGGRPSLRGWGGRRRILGRGRGRGWGGGALVEEEAVGRPAVVVEAGGVEEFGVCGVCCYLLV